MFLWQNNQVQWSPTTQNQEGHHPSLEIRECHECACNSDVVMSQLQKQPAVPLKRKRRYCEWPVFNVLSPSSVDGWNHCCHTASHPVSLFHSGRLKGRIVSSHRTAVSTCGFRLFHSSEETAALISVELTSVPKFSFCFTGELERHLQLVSAPRHGAFDQQREVRKELCQ